MIALMSGMLILIYFFHRQHMTQLPHHKFPLAKSRENYRFNRLDIPEN